MKAAILIASLVVSGLVHAAAVETPTGQFQIDNKHSKIGFEIPHMVISSVDGQFNDFKGDIDFNKKFEDSKVSVVIQVDSIDTGVKDRNDHLKSPDFFDAKKFKEITFKSTEIKGDAKAFDLTGDLTLHGVTKKITLKAKFLGVINGMMGERRAAFTANGKINRKDFGLVWGKMVEAGPVVGDEAELSLKIEATQPGKK